MFNVGRLVTGAATALDNVVGPIKAKPVKSEIATRASGFRRVSVGILDLSGEDPILIDGSELVNEGVSRDLRVGVERIW